MLLKVAFPQDSSDFKKGMKAIEKAYWPFNDIAERIILTNNDEETFQETLKDKIKGINTSPDIGSYTVLSKNAERMLPFPFLDKFYNHFSMTTSGRNADDLTAMRGRDNMLRDYYTLPSKNFKKSFFKNAGNYNHFINVVAATACLIRFFSNEDNIRAYLCKDKEKGYWWHLSDTLKYQNNQDQKMRIMNLMFAAFYHDIGKSLVNERHGMEGANILSFLTTESVFQLQVIAKELTFFQKIARRILYKTFTDLAIGDNNFQYISRNPTGWISTRPERDERIKLYTQVYNLDQRSYEEYYSTAQSKIFLDNFTTTLMRIIFQVISRAHSFDHIRNLEFKEANERLTNEKIDLITSQEGPARSGRTIEMVVQTIFYW